MYSKNTKVGFTLIELLIVIAIIGSLASVVVVSLTGSTDDANEKVAKTNLSQTRRLFTKLVSVDVNTGKLEWKELCTKDLIEVSNIQEIVTIGFKDVGGAGSEYADGTGTSNITFSGTGNETQGFLKASLNTTTATIADSTAGCISSNADGPNNAKGSWVIWVTGGTSVFCVDSGSSTVRKIELSTSKKFVADTNNLNSVAPNGVGCDDIKV